MPIQLTRRGYGARFTTKAPDIGPTSQSVPVKSVNRPAPPFVTAAEPVKLVVVQGELSVAVNARTAPLNVPLITPVETLPLTGSWVVHVPVTAVPDCAKKNVMGCVHAGLQRASLTLMEPV